MPAYHGMEGKKEEKSEWITVGGRRIEIKDGENVEDKLAEKPQSLRGAKESNTKEARKFIKRHGIKKALFKLRDAVVFDQLTKSGIIYSLDGDYVKILSKGNNYERRTEDVFKADEITPLGHWDTMTKSDRIKILEIIKVSGDYMNTDWYWLPTPVKDIILKEAQAGGAGFSTNSSGVYNPVYNPIKDEKRIQDTIDEEKTKPKESKNEKE